MSAGMRYFQVDGYNILHGSLRRDTPVERVVWMSLMALCSLSRVWGEITSNAGEPYDDDYIAFMCGVSLDEYKAALQHHIAQGRVEITAQGALKLVNWDDYQNTGYARVAKHRQRKKLQKPVTESVTNVTKPVTVDTKCNKSIEENRIEEKIKEENNSTTLRAKKTRETVLNATQLERFNRFWTKHPKKRAKGDAEKAWKVIDPDDALTSKIVSALDVAAKCEQWTKDGGQFIPYPATWLRAKGWEDEYNTEKDQVRRTLGDKGLENYNNMGDWLNRKEVEDEKQAEVCGVDDSNGDTI